MGSRLTRENDMVTDTDEYKGRKFTCDNCGYTVSSSAMTDFDVDDFNFCPYCGMNNNEEDRKTEF
jgi:transcription elongation factor Elf1